MRSSSHLLHSIPSSSPPLMLSAQSICPSCLHLLSVVSPKDGQQASRRHNSTGPPEFWQRMRRRIWQKDQAPGPENPYDPAFSQHAPLSLVEKRRRAKAEADRKASGEVSDPTSWKNSPELMQPRGHYKPATTWQGLEHVGYTGAWMERPELAKERFTPYMRGEKVLGREGLLRAIHRATVEVVTLQRAARPLTDSSQAGVIDRNEMGDLIGRVEVVLMEKGRVTLKYPRDEAEDEILKGTEVAEVPEAEEELEVEGEDGWTSAEQWDRDSGVLQTDNAFSSVEEPPTPSPEAATMAAMNVSSLSTHPIDEGFLDTPLDNPEVKFAILKRTTQLTSHIIPDPSLPKITSLLTLLATLLDLSAPKPKNLYENLTLGLAGSQEVAQPTDGTSPKDARKETSILAALPNVKIYDRRQTPIDKEKVIGRWKVIERELRAKGLPVTGNRIDHHLVQGRWGNGRRPMHY